MTVAIVIGKAGRRIQPAQAWDHVAGVTLVGTIPAEVQPVFSFDGALTATVQQPEAAGALIRFLASSEAAPVISRAGLLPPSER